MSKKIIKGVFVIVGIVLALLSISLWPYMIIVLVGFWLTRLVRGKRQYQGIQLAAITLLLLISLIEIYFRIDGKYMSYLEKTGSGSYQSPYQEGNHTWYHVRRPHKIIDFKQHEYSGSWSTNNEGFRDADFAIAKRKIRIIAIGDSYTEGAGASNDSSFPEQLSYILMDSFRRSTEVWNCGVSGSDPIEEFRLFDDKLLKYNPDMLIVVMNGSDISDVIIRGGFERFQPNGKIRYKDGPWFVPLYGCSYIVRRIVHDGYKYNWQFIPFDEEAKERADAVHMLTTAIDSFSRVCAEKNIKLLFVIHPSMWDFGLTEKYECKLLFQYCSENHLPCIDIRDELYKMGWDSAHAAALFWPVDGHCKNNGYHCFAECVWRRVAEILKE